MSSHQPDYVEFKIEGAENKHEVPVSILTQALLGFQQLVYLFALQSEGKTVHQRARLPEEIKQKYVLRCCAPQPGSVVVAARVGDLRRDLLAPQDIGKTMGSLHRFSRFAVQGNSTEIRHITSDTRLCFKMLFCLRSMAPPAGSGYQLSFKNSTGDAVMLNEEVSARIDTLINEQPEEQSALQTVTGKLNEIRFTQHQLTIDYAPRHRTLECFYKEDIEPMLFENRRDLIQVTGKVIVDEDNHPMKIVEVENIQDLDLSPFVVSEMTDGSLKIRFKKPLELVPTLSESQQLIHLFHKDLNIDVFASTRVSLLSELKEQVLMMWHEYVQEDDSNLADSARELKQYLIAAIRET